MTLFQRIKALFALGEQGAWYDPSDFSTMWQDSAGTTPVTAVEQPVGKILDKSGRGNHATQATSASRPTLSARVNLLTYSEDFSNAAWTKTDATATASSIVEAAITNVHRMFEQPVGDAGTVGTYTLAVDAKPLVGTRYLVLGANNSTENYSSVVFNLQLGTITQTLTAGTFVGVVTSSISAGSDGYYRCTITVTNVLSVQAHIGMSNATTFASFSRGFNSYAGDGASSLSIRNAQFETGSTATRYQSITTATSYDTVGFKTYLKFDGVDDSLSTGSIDFTSTDKMTVFAGVRKLSDANQAIVVELSAALALNNGSFSMQAPSATPATNLFYFGSKGTAIGAVNATSAAFAAPKSAVMTGIASISTDQATLRINGAEAVTSAVDQGTGNYGNYPLFIGRRGGTSLPFNGHLYSLIVRGAQSSYSQIASAESYVNSKTGAY
jgi:hypothetical protein